MEYTVALEKILKTRIAEHGPITVAEYMDFCLGHPEYGYYMTRDPFGKKGDFTTAPEVSQMFGEIIGAWVMQVWHDLNEPSEFHLIEMGPGRGTLMSDILRICTKNTDFQQAAQIQLIETSPVLKKLQQKTLSGYDVTWSDSLHPQLEHPIIFVANELLDALPIHQFIKRDDKWYERHIGLDKNNAFKFVEQKPSFDPRMAFQNKDMEEGTVFELCPAAINLTHALARQIKDNGGAALFIDYGALKSGFGDTLQAVKDHKTVDVFDHPGEADLTAHVDFERLYDISIKSGLHVPPMTTQGHFLKSLGIGLRAEMLKAQNKVAAKDIQSQLKRLVHNDEMGRLFKVFGFADPSIQLAGFENVYI